MLTVREAKAGDGETLFQFVMELAEYEKLAHCVVATAADIEARLTAANTKLFGLIVEDNGTPIGMALYFYNFSTFRGRHGIYIEDLYVKPESRGTGAGKLMLQKLAAIAKANDCARIEWWVLDWNAPAIAFYKKLGAVPMDEWTVFRLEGEPLDRLAA
jgi:GNAT superfamily N-acetyltransferase